MAGLIKGSDLLFLMLDLFLFLLLSFPLVDDAHAAPGTPEICKEYIRDGDLARGHAESRDSIPYGTGLLWNIEDDTGIRGHLFGVMHSQDRLVTRLPPQVRLVLAQSRLLVMEVIPDNAADQAFAGSMYFTDGTRLPGLLHQNIYDLLLRKLPDYGIDREQVQNIKPWAAFTLIGRPRPVRAATQDAVLMDMASDLNKTVAGLEDMRELVIALDGISMSDQIRILNDTVCNHERIIRNTRDLVNMYVARDLAGMVIFNKQPHHDEAVFNRFMQRIVYDRNQRMLERMLVHMTQGGAFIAVGALHLPGEKGLLKMLEQRGYKLTRVY